MALIKVDFGEINNIDISDIVGVSVNSVAISTRKHAMYTVGINTLNIKNNSTGYSIRLYDSPTASTYFDTVPYSSNKDIPVSDYNVIYFDTASTSSIVVVFTVVD